MRSKYFYDAQGVLGNIILTDSAAIINDESIDFEYRIAGSSAMIRINNLNYDVRLIEDSGNVMKLLVNGKEMNVKMQALREQLAEKAGAGESTKKQNNKIISPMPGIISKICKQVGDKLEKGDVIVVLEAMKMENELKAGHSSFIKKINIKEKQSVDKGQLLIELGEG